MTATLAFLIYILFLVAAFAWMRRDRPAVSPALWIPQLWIMISATRPVNLWVHASPVVQQDLDFAAGNPVDRLVLSILLAAGVAVLLRRRVDWRAAIAANRWLVLLFLLMGASILWSGAPSVSFKRWVRTSGDLIMVLVVLSDARPMEAVRTLVMRMTVILLPLSIVLIKYVPSIGIAYTTDGLSTMWIGATTHKNELGALCMLCGVFLVWKMLEEPGRRRIDFLDAVLMLQVLWLLGGSTTADSKTAILVFLLGSVSLAALHLLSPSPRMVGRLLVGIGLSYAVLNVLSETVANASLYDIIVQASGRDPTLTGRTDLWVALLGIAAHDPVLGKGYGSFWIGNTHHLWDVFRWFPTQAHNGYLDVYLQLGLAGVMVLTGTIISSYRSIIGWMEGDAAGGHLRLVFFMMILAHNFTESSFLRGSSVLWDFFLLFAILPLARQKKPAPILIPQGGGL